MKERIWSRPLKTSFSYERENLEPSSAGRLSRMR